MIFVLVAVILLMCFLVVLTEKAERLFAFITCVAIFGLGHIHGFINTNDTIKQTMLNNKPYHFQYESDDDGNDYMMFVKLDRVEKIKVEK